MTRDEAPMEKAMTATSKKRRISWITKLEVALDQFEKGGGVECDDLYIALVAARNDVNDLRARLDRQWEWFDIHPDSDVEEDLSDSFIRTLSRYEEGYRLCAEAEQAVSQCRSR